MKLFKFFVLAVAFALTFSLMSCDVASMTGDIDGALEGVIGNGNGESENVNSEGVLDDGLDGEEDEGDYDPNSSVHGHTCNYELVDTRHSTCDVAGENKYQCSCGKTKSEELPLALHTEVVDPAKAPTATEPGLTEGKHCSVCGTVTVKQEYVFAGDYSVLEKYDGDYAYNSLLECNNSEKLTKLYKRIDEYADAFHSSNTNLEKNNGVYVVADVDFSDLGITTDEAIGVWSAYRIDRPLYYWISNQIVYVENEYLCLVCDEEYAAASVRASINAKIYKGVERFVTEAYSQSKYNMALGFHDLIILAIDYAYEADGRTPEDDVWAHNITGVFEKGVGVCEAYSKTFQLLLNYCDIENVLVFGWAKEAHAWNLIKLDDGGWYWCDLTWDDTPEFAWGISYKYFCVNDTENVDWSDGPFVQGSESFLESHTPNGKIDTGINYSYNLPARSSTKFDGADIMLRDTFDIGDLTYAIAGYNSVQLVSVNAGGNVTVPASVTYSGKEFNVIAIGKMDGFRFTTGSIASYINGIYTEQYTVGKVSIPESVIFIWDDAFNIDSLTEISVSADNGCFASVDGVLFTKDLSVLIKYPTAKLGAELTLPSETVIIAAGAFDTLYSNTGDKLVLERIYLSASSVKAGVKNYGYGYEKAKYFQQNPWYEIKASLSGDAAVYDKNGSALEAA